MRERKNDEARNRIADAVIQLVADATGISRRTIYHYFPDRDSLLATASTRVREMAGTRLAIQGLRAFLDSGAPGRDTPKGLALFDAVATEKPDRLIVGSSKDVTALKEWAAEHLPDTRIEVAGAGEIIPDQTAVALSLMSRRSFDKLVDPVPTSRLRLVGYDFECDIYRSRLRWRTKRRKALRPDRVRTPGIKGATDRPVAPD